MRSTCITAPGTDNVLRLPGAEENLSGGHVGPAHCVRFSFDDGFVPPANVLPRCSAVSGAMLLPSIPV
eukprot:3464407-Rhodomonas_salina.6